MQELRQRLFSLQDLKYQAFHNKLCPGTTNIIGVRVPQLRALAKEILLGDCSDYIKKALKQKNPYYEETVLLGMVLSNAQIDFAKLLPLIANYVPLITNWAICDIFCCNLKTFKKQQPTGRIFLQTYLKSQKEYTLRFGIVMLLAYYINDTYIENTLEQLNAIKHDNYYVKMAVAWALSICFIKYRNLTLNLFLNNTLDDFTYNKALQKCCESFRVTAEDKILLRSLKRKS